MKKTDLLLCTTLVLAMTLALVGFTVPGAWVAIVAGLLTFPLWLLAAAAIGCAVG